MERKETCNASQWQQLQQPALRRFFADAVTSCPVNSCRWIKADCLKALSSVGKTGGQLVGTQGQVQCTPSFYRASPRTLPAGRELSSGGCETAMEEGIPSSGQCIREPWVGWRSTVQLLCCLLYPLNRALCQESAPEGSHRSILSKGSKHVSGEGF